MLDQQAATSMQVSADQDLKGSLLLALVALKRGTSQVWVPAEPQGDAVIVILFPFLPVPMHTVLHNKSQ